MKNQYTLPAFLRQLSMIVMSAILPFFGLQVYAQPDIPAPDAPELSVSWLGNHMVLSLSNSLESNNYMESYQAVDPNITEGDSLWVFQGYLIYQVQLPFDITDIHDPNVSRLVIQTDVADNVSSLYTAEYDDELGECVPVLEVSGINGGLATEFTLSSDMWNGPFVLGQIYCYIAIAYASNPNGISTACPDLPYQFFPGYALPGGQPVIQCATAQNPLEVDHLDWSEYDVYPNPASATITLSNTDRLDRIVIRDAIGNVVVDLDHAAQSIDVSALEQGVYLVELHAGNDKMVRRLLVN
ncbi:MAG: T9SS type A sorting domain-containing protein [Flavobacteriales bacterium]|nr:T9SS type A sorting domain-containing protein [Flavobacteriales bacterium]